MDREGADREGADDERAREHRDDAAAVGVVARSGVGPPPARSVTGGAVGASA